MTQLKFIKRHGLLLTSLVLAACSAPSDGTADDGEVGSSAEELTQGYTFPNQLIATEGKSHIGEQGGQCKVFAEHTVNAVLADKGISKRVLGYGNGGAYYAVYQNAGGKLVPFEEAQPGDLIQSINAAHRNEDDPPTAGLHTAIAIAAPNGGDIDVVDSNWVAPEKVGTHTWHAKSWSSSHDATLYVWRFGTVGTSAPPTPQLPSTPRDGMMVSNNGEVYVVAGGAPLYVTSFDRVAPPAEGVFSVDAAYMAKMRALPADGTFIQGSPSNEVYVIAGGAPQYVSSWTNVGGQQGRPVIKVDDAAIAGAGGAGRYSHLLPVPADGTFVAGGVSREAYVIVGGAPEYITAWARVGSPSKPVISIDDVTIANAGGAARYGHLNRVPADGSFIAGGVSGEVYVIAGGAPQYITAWSAVRSPTKPVVTTVDDTTIANAGSTDHLFSHLEQYPVDGTYVVGGASNAVHVIAGGAPEYVTSWANMGVTGGVSPIVIDDAVLNGAGSTGRYGHLRLVPQDGTFIAGKPTNEAYVIAGGAPIYITAWANVANHSGKPITGVDATTIANAGGTGLAGHLKRVPADGTFIRDLQGTIYRVEGGAPIYVSTLSAFSGQTVVPVDVDAAAIAGATPTVPRLSHLSFYPADGTKLTGSPGSQRYVVQGGVPILDTGTAAFPGTSLVDQIAIDRHGDAGPYAHLK